MTLPSAKYAQYEKFQDVTNGRMRYYEFGAGEPTLLLHGMGVPTSADTFQFMFDHLAGRLKVYALDYLGFGKSTRKMEYGPTFDVIVDGIREFMDAKGLTRVNLVGHSAGAWFGSLLAYQSPDRVNRCVYIGPAGLNITPVASVSGYAQPTREGTLNSLQASVFPGSAVTPEIAEELADQMLAMATMPDAFEGLQPLVDQMANPASRRQYLLHRHLPLIKAPILWLWATGDNMEPLPTWTEEFDKLGGDMSQSTKPWVSPNSKYFLVEGGHNCHWEQPETIARYVLDFLLEQKVPQPARPQGTRT
jgi:pimeloyl-ACP methyl ester carboxylesterase